MQAINRKVQDDREVFEVQYGTTPIEFAIPLGVFEPSDIVILNADAAHISTDDPGFEEILQALADFAWNMRHPMRVEFFVGTELVPALTENNFEGLSDSAKYRIKQWSIQARQHNHDMFFTDAGIEQEAICEVFSQTKTCRQIFAHYNLATKLDPTRW